MEVGEANVRLDVRGGTSSIGTVELDLNTIELRLLREDLSNLPVLELRKIDTGFFFGVVVSLIWGL